MAPREFAIFIYDGVQSLDLTGPFEVFDTAARLAGPPVAHRVRTVAPTRGPVRTSSGLTVVADLAMAELDAVDTLVIAGGNGVRTVMTDETVLAWTRHIAATARRVASVCTGAFLLAEAGLLDGRRATTHWANCDHLAERYPAVTVDSDPIFIRDGNVTTSAGVTAGMDLALALVEEDLGPAVAREVARWLVMFVQRPGGQAQFSTLLRAQSAERASLKDLQAWVADNVAADLSVPALAERACMSPRHFARVFTNEIGMTPAAYVETVRVERARLALESTDTPVEAVASACGFGTAETMRRAFQRRLGVPPAHYRRHFHAA